MAFLHVTKGSQAGASIELKNEQNYTVSSNLDYSDVYLFSEIEYSFNLVINEFGVVFSNIHGVSLKDQKNELIVPDELYLFDTVLSFFTHEIILTQQDSIPAKYSPDLDGFLENISDNSEAELEFDDLNDSATERKIVQKLDIFARKIIKYSVSQYFIFKRKLGQAFYPVFTLISLLPLLLIVTVFVVHKDNQNNRMVQMRMNIIEAKQHVQKIILNLPADTYGSITVSYEKSYFVIKGVLPNDAALKYLKKVLSKVKHSNIVYHIILFSDIKEITLAICKNNNIMNPAVNISDNFGFTISIQGIANSIDDINNAEIELHNKFSNLQQVDTSQIYMVSDLENYWNNLPHGLKQQVIVTYDLEEGLITLTGVASKDELVVLQQYIKNFNAKYAPLIKINANVKDVINTLPFSVKEVFIGTNVSWLVTNDGSVIYPGGSYKGVTVLSITPTAIKFRTSFIFSVPINELIALDNMPSANYDSSDDNTCGRDCIIKEEFSKENNIIIKEKKQLIELNKIIKLSKESELNTSLADTINNLKADIETKEHEINYYKQEKHD